MARVYRNALGVAARLDAVPRMAAGRSIDGPPEEFSFGKDLRNLFDTNPSNTFLVKVSYRLNP